MALRLISKSVFTGCFCTPGQKCAVGYEGRRCCSIYPWDIYTSWINLSTISIVEERGEVERSEKEDVKGDDRKSLADDLCDIRFSLMSAES